MRFENVDDIFALAPMQQLMLTHSLTAPVSYALAHQFRYRLTGDLQVDRFRQAWEELVVRHPALRTSMLWEGLKEPVQVVRSEAVLPFAYVDLCGLSSSDREQRLSALADADRRQGFDLREAPLIRLTLVRLDVDQFYLLWSRHHLILDRWCVDLLFEELFQLYATGLSLNELSLPPAGAFKDYIAWVRQQNLKDAELYWRNELRSLNQPTLLFESRARRMPWSAGGLPSIDEVLEDDLYKSLRDLAKRYRVSLATVLQAGVALLVWRRTGRDDVVFGLTVSGRPMDLPNVDRTIGSFINNVPVRVRMEPAAKIADLLESIHASQVGRIAFDYVSPVDIHRWSSFTADKPMFDLLALLHSPPTEIRKGPGFDIEQILGPIDGTHSFTLSLAETLGRLRLSGAYNPECVSLDNAKLLLVDLGSILRNIVAAPETPLKEMFSTEGGSVSVRTETGVDSTCDGSTFRRRPAAACQAHLNGASGVLSEIWCKTLGIDHVEPDDDFFALGGTSIQAALAFSEMERRLGVNLPLSTLFEAGSVRELLEVLGRPLERTSSLVEIQPYGTQPKLFVVPGIGGNVVGLAGLARSLGPEQPFYGFQSKGLDGRERPENRIEDIASQFIAEMTPVIDGPFVLFGICWGSSVAFEMARQLSAAGRAPALLLLMDPVYHNEPKVWVGLESQALTMLRFCTDRLRLYWSEFRTLKGRQKARLVREKIELVISMAHHGDPFRGNRSEISQRRVSEANLGAMMRYRPMPCDIPAGVLLTADRKVDRENDPRLQWTKFLRADSPVSCIPGQTTGEALSAENIEALANHVRRFVDRAAVASCAGAIGVPPRIGKVWDKRPVLRQNPQSESK